MTQLHRSTMPKHSQDINASIHLATSPIGWSKGGVVGGGVILINNVSIHCVGRSVSHRHATWLACGDPTDKLSQNSPCVLLLLGLQHGLPKLTRAHAVHLHAASCQVFHGTSRRSDGTEQHGTCGRCRNAQVVDTFMQHASRRHKLVN